MEKFRTYGRRTPEESEREKKHRLLARRAAAEGMVLLKNDGVLPLSEKKVALYGAGARMTVSGGTGSGDMHGRNNVSIEQGLLNAGYKIVNPCWLDRFDADYTKKRQTWKDEIEEKIKGYTMERVLEMFEIVNSVHFHFPTGDYIGQEDLSDETDTAIYVIARQAGEGEDRRTEKGDFLLDDVERCNLESLAGHYKKILVVVNCGGMLDLSFLDEIPQIGAVLFYGQGGTEGGNAFADLVSGKVSPSGKLADTWAMKYADYPSADAYQSVTPKQEEENYTEGIYVGYRYFSSFGISPRYGFGYGLSYTVFSCRAIDFRVETGKLVMTVSVKNEGSQYAGKEVVQVYIRKPWGRLDHETLSLGAFQKTKELAPGEEQKLTLEVPLEKLASYDESVSEWFLEKGEYGIYAGTSLEQAEPAVILTADTEIVLEKNERVCPLEKPFETIRPEYRKADYKEEIPRLAIPGEAIEVICHDYNKPAVRAERKVKEILQSLSLDELASLCAGGGQFGNTYNITPGAVGWTTMNLLEKGIPNVNFADGPAGLRLETESVIEKDGTKKYLHAIPEEQRWGCVREMEAYALGDPDHGILVYQYMTAWPAEHVQAQTWNTELLEEIGDAVGKEMLETGVGLWLAPAMNIHRNPLCGRNFEYYSEDPFLSAMLASAITKGVQKHEGIGVTVKHFCCNNRETNRTGISENVTERTLRELYLRGFRYVLEEAHPKAVMSSYNRVNGVYAVNNYDLLVKILRCEWGYKGLVMSDWGASGSGKGSHEAAPVSGNDLVMPGGEEVALAIRKAAEEKRVSREELEWCAAHVLNLVFDSFTTEK